MNSQKILLASEELCSFSTVEDHNHGRKVRIHKIFRAGEGPIVRHIKVKASANPFDKACPELVSGENSAYFNKRRSDLKQKAKRSKRNCIMIHYKKDINKTLLNLWKYEPVTVQNLSIKNA